MSANQKDLKRFYGMLRENVYPKNGSWKDAVAMKHLATALLFVMATLEILARVWGVTH